MKQLARRFFRKSVKERNISNANTSSFFEVYGAYVGVGAPDNVQAKGGQCAGSVQVDAARTLRAEN